MNRKFTSLFIVIFLLVVGCSRAAYTQSQKAYNLISPDGNIKLVVDQSTVKFAGAAKFSIYYKTTGKYTPLTLNNILGVSTDQAEFKVVNLKRAGAINRINEKYEMVTGKRRLCANAANERSFTFANSAGKTLDVIFRVYNDGVAFRYKLPKWTNTPVNIKDEYTTYQIPAETARWIQTYDPSYEKFFPYSTTGKGEKNQQWGYPALFKAKNLPVWYLITEADNSDVNCAARLTNEVNLNTYKVTYSEPRNTFQQRGNISLLPWTSQWHTLIIGSLATLVQSTLVTDVSKPSTLKKTDGLYLEAYPGYIGRIITAQKTIKKWLSMLTSLKRWTGLMC